MSFSRLVLLVARRDYLRTVRRRGFVFGTLLLPLSIVFFMLVSSIVSSVQIGGGPNPSSVTLVVVSDSPVDVRTDLVPNLRVVDPATADRELGDGTIAEYYRIPASWPEAPTVTRVSAEGGSGLEGAQRQATQQQLLEAVLRAALLRDSDLDPATQTRVIVPVQVEMVTLSGQQVTDLSVIASFLIPFAFTLLFVMSIFITSGYLLQSVTEEKENRVVEIVLSSVPSLPLMAGKLLGLGAAGLTQVVVWIGTAVIFLPLIGDRMGSLEDLHLDPTIIVLAVVYFVLGYLAFGAIFAAIGALAPGNREAQQYSGFFGFFAVIPLIFSSVIMTDPTAPIVWVLALIPLTAPATMLQVVTLSESIPWPMVMASLLGLSIWVVVATVGASRIFRATLLLYGVRPSMRQLADAVLNRR
jgi:ABC-2 type transport system permease protein